MDNQIRDTHLSHPISLPGSTTQYRDAGLFRSEMSAVDNNLVNTSTTRISFYTTL